MEKLLTVKQVAEKLQYTPETVKKLIKSKDLKARRMPWEYRIRIEDLEDFISKDREAIDNV